MKLCKDCKYYQAAEDPQYSRCGHERCAVQASINLVTGEVKLASLGYCSVERSGNWSGSFPCGQDGLLWRAKP
jgi:hypothetical protein